MGDELDQAYLDETADLLGVTALLVRLRADTFGRGEKPRE
jgi:hypothetical protein